MNLSEYLKLRLSAEKKIALSFDRGAKNVDQAIKEASAEVYSGFEIFSWYSSCVFDMVTCKELFHEDGRMILCIREVFSRHDVIFDMLQLYINYLLRNYNEKKLANPYTPMQKQIITLTALLGKTTSSKATRLSLSYVITKAISDDKPVKALINASINTRSYYIMTIFQYYGKVQRAAMAARNLKRINPEFYYLLYSNRLEMLYIY